MKKFTTSKTEKIISFVILIYLSLMIEPVISIILTVLIFLYMFLKIREQNEIIIKQNKQIIANLKIESNEDNE